jgi:Uma2 family endonuclease
MPISPSCGPIFPSPTVELPWRPSAKVYNARWNPNRSKIGDMKGAAVSQYREAIEHLPPGAMLVVHDVSWEAYEHLLDALEDRPGVRVTFDQGRLQAVSPFRKHEQYSRLVDDLALFTAMALGLPIEKLGATTLRQPERERGVEADCCFYIANAHRIAGKETLDLQVDPPPDIAVEIDLSTDSHAKLPIYAGLGVPEIWLYNGLQMRILELRDDNSGYFDVSQSKFLECLTTSVLERFLELSKTNSQTEVLRVFRAWLEEWR